MRYCHRRELSHPHCVVLDSPLVSLRERKKADVDGEVSEEVQQAFFSDLAKMSSNEQLIILENKEPTPDVQASINYIEFTGTKDVRRQGFFPPINGAKK